MHAGGDRRRQHHADEGKDKLRRSTQSLGSTCNAKRTLHVQTHWANLQAFREGRASPGFIIIPLTEKGIGEAPSKAQQTKRSEASSRAQLRATICLPLKKCPDRQYHLRALFRKIIIVFFLMSVKQQSIGV